MCEKNIFVYTVMRRCALSRFCCRRFEEGDNKYRPLRPANGKKTILDIIGKRFFPNRKRSDSNLTLRQEFSLTQTAAVYG